MALPAIPTRHQDSGAHRQRIAETVNGVTSFQFDDSRVRTTAEIVAGVTPVNYAYAPEDARRHGVVADGVTDDTAALNRAIASLNGNGGRISIPIGTLLVTSMIVLPSRVSLVGQGYSETNGTGASSRGATCILRGMTGDDPTIYISGDDVLIDHIDFDNNNQGTGDCVQVCGSRVIVGTISCRNSGHDGFRVGATELGASSINANCGYARLIIATGNADNGIRFDHTNTTTSTSYPLGLADANAWFVAMVDVRSNGLNGLSLGNCNDNVFGNVVAQSNAGCGIRFNTDGTNSGPRCNTILSNDCEVNTGNDIQIDAATLPAAAPGLYNRVLGNRSVAVSSRIVDNSTGSLVLQWNAGLGFRAYTWGSDINALATSGAVGFNAYVGANAAPARFYGAASGTVDSIARISVHKNGGSQTDGCEVNQNAVFRPLNNLVPVTYSASITIDAAKGHLFEVTATNGTAFTINAPTNPYAGQQIGINIRNNSGGVLGAVTWNAVFKMTAFGAPANGFQRVTNFYYDGSNWLMRAATSNDVPL